MKNIDTKKIEQAIKSILEAIGEDINREGIKYTPVRVARLFNRLFYRYTKQLKVMNEKERNSSRLPDYIIPVTTFKTESKDMLVRKVNFLSTCEHHLATITNGECWVGIIPSGILLGMNKIDKIVQYFAAGLQIQERLTSEIADWIMDNIKPYGVIVVMKANHLCAELQGDEGHFTTSAVRGVFKDNPTTKEEFFQLIKLKVV